MNANESCEFILEIGYPFREEGSCVAFAEIMCYVCDSPIKIQSGDVKEKGSNERSQGHFWVTSGNRIIDPTKAQFKFRGKIIERSIDYTYTKRGFIRSQRGHSYIPLSTTKLKRFVKELLKMKPNISKDFMKY